MPIPSQALFRMYGRSVQQIVSGNFSQSDIGAPPPIATISELQAYYAAGIDNPAIAPRLHQSVNFGGNYVPAAGDYELRFTPNSEMMFDPTGTPVTYSILDGGFPKGMVANQFRVWVNGNILTGGRNKYLDNYKFKGDNNVVYDVNPPNNLSGDFLQTSNEFGPSAFSNLWWGVHQVFDTTMGISAHVSTVVDASGFTPNLRIDEIYIEGIYTLLVLSVTSDVQNAGPLGEVVINGLNLDFFDEFSVNWYDEGVTDPLGFNTIPIPPNNIVTHTNVLLTIRIPEGVPLNVQLQIMAVQTSGVNFTGSVLLTQINTQLVDGSGIYKLVPGKTNDTYYDRSVAPVGTLDLKIPDPFIRTGFFKG